MVDGFQRNTAFKVWIADLINAKYIKGLEQFESGYIEVKGNKISRVNIVGTIIDSFAGNNYFSVSIDDGSGLLKLKAWNENVNLLKDLQVGNFVLVIGKIKDYNNSIYVTPEIVRKLDNPLWLKVRKLELIKLYGEVNRVENIANTIPPEFIEDEHVMTVVEEKVGESEVSTEKLFGTIEELDKGEGADVEEVVKKLGSRAREVIQELIVQGELFELRKGKLRVMG